MAGAAILFLALARPCNAIDWQPFDDPKAVTYFTNAYADAIRALPAPEKAAAVVRLQGSLKSIELEIRRRAALTLGDLGDMSGVPVMIEDLAKASGQDRDDVVVSLRILRDRRAIPPLRQALKDPSPYVRCIAAEALGELKAVEAYDQIVALALEKGTQPETNTSRGLNCVVLPPACSACYALGALGDQRAVPVLINLLADKEIQSSAQQALESLTGQKLGPDPTKWKDWLNARKQSTR
jgi:HEAT repeat protein